MYDEENVDEEFEIGEEEGEIGEGLKEEGLDDLDEDPEDKYS